MAESVLRDVSTALDLMVLEQLPGGGFSRTLDFPEPGWFVRAFQRVTADEPLSLLDVVPVLDAFLQDAETFWSSGTEGRTDSEPFVIADEAGTELAIVATALSVRGRRYLVMQPAVAFKDTQRLLQTARDQSLAHERLVRQLQALQKPIATLGRLVGDPAFTSDGPPAADAVRQQVDILRGLAGELPRAPQAATPKSR
jgi:hypothetical protein